MSAVAAIRLIVGSDHAGRRLRLAVADALLHAGHQVLDIGYDGEGSVDYPAIAAQLARQVAQGEASLGVLCCATGVGMSMAANRVVGVRAAVCTHALMAGMARAHNDANVLCLGEQIVGTNLALRIVQAFVDGRFEGGRHARRVGQLGELEGAD